MFSFFFFPLSFFIHFTFQPCLFSLLSIRFIVIVGVEAIQMPRSDDSVLEHVAKVHLVTPNDRILTIMACWRKVGVISSFLDFVVLLVINYDH